jgi:hypothetical protein
MPDNRYLDWSIAASGDTFASTSRGCYSTEEMPNGYEARWDSPGERPLFLGHYGTSDEAENACQHHYETWRAEAA